MLAGAFGAMIAEGEGFVFGASLGGLFGLVLQARSQLSELRVELRRLTAELRETRTHLEGRIASTEIAVLAARTSAASPLVEAAPTAMPAPAQDSPLPAAASAAQLATAAAAEAQPAEAALAEPALSAPRPPLEPAAALAQTLPEPPRPRSLADYEPDAEELAAMRPKSPDAIEQGIEWVRSFFFGGNTVVRVGILVLLVGVALLLRWAAEHEMFPIEARMGGAALIALALIVVGFRQREAKPGFGRTLQGGGIAALYLVVFFSYRAYDLLPSGLAFGLLAVIALFSGILAVVQDAMALIVIGQIGGFMAPVLASSGGGSHVGLFSYYLVLNLLTLGIAWKKPWRAVNLIGFVFTFGVGSTWGALRYKPQDFASTEPFLIAFFLLYAAIPVLHALRQPAPATTQSGALNIQRGWVDGSLVFGTPLAVLVLQYAMVREMPFAMAYSTVAMAAVYIGLSRYLHKRAPEALRAMIEAFLAIGIGFATIAIPYGLDNQNLTGATWALEGAGLYWMGVRQSRWLSRAAGAALQGAALIALVSHLDGWSAPGLPLANTLFLAGVLSMLGMMFIACYAQLHRAQLSAIEANGAQAFIALGLSMFLAVSVREMEAHLEMRLRAGVLLAWVGGVAIALELVGQRLAWLAARLHAVLVFPALALALLVWHVDFDVHPLAQLGWLGFPIAFAAAGLLVKKLVPDAPALRLLHVVLAWELVAFAAIELAQLVSDVARLSDDWAVSAACAMIAGAIFFLLARVRSADAAAWPFGQYAPLYRIAAAGLTAFALLMTLTMNATLPGELSPLPYLPLLSAIDLAQLLAFAAAIALYRALRERDDLGGLEELVRALVPVTSVFAFIAWNGLLARSVHAYANVPFDADALWRSVPLQVSLSISWTLLGLFATVLASKRGARGLWIVGASLLGIVVVKLFVLDLVRLETVAKIGTFLAVGLLLVLVGYYAPVPPSAAKTEAA